MPNGKPGDHPYTDIVIHGRDVYSSDIAKLVREIDQLASEKEREDLGDLLLFKFGVFSNPDTDELERILTELRDKMRDAARSRGSED